MMEEQEFDLGIDGGAPEKKAKPARKSRKKKTSAPGSDAGETPTFEQALERLEKIVETMEGGKLPLDTCMQQFEEGTRLASLCLKQLEETEKKVELLLSKDGAGEWAELDGSEDD